MSFSLLLFVLSTVSSGGGQQAALCQVYPSNYSFITGHIENLMSIDQSRCTNNASFTTCQHPSTLTDSITGGNTSNTEDYLVWNSTNQFSNLLFTFPTQIPVHTITLYYYTRKQTESQTATPIELNFYAASDDYELWVNEVGTKINSVTLLPQRSQVTSSNFILVPTMMRKLRVSMNNANGHYQLGLSEVKFYRSDCDKTISPATVGSPTTTSSQTTSYEVTQTTSYEVTQATSYEVTQTDPPNSFTSSSTTIAGMTDLDKDSSPPVEYIAAAIVAVILAIAGLIVMVIVIMAYKRKRNSVKDKDFKGSNPDLYDSPNFKLSPLTGQVESPPSSKATTDKPVEANDDPGGVQATYAVVNKQKKKNRRKGNQSSDPPDIPQPYQQATPTESHDTAHDTYAVVDMTKKKNRKKKKMDSHLDSEGDPPPVPEHTIDQLYAVVQKKPKKKKEEIPTTDEDTDAPPVPAQTMEEL